MGWPWAGSVLQSASSLHFSRFRPFSR